MTERSVNRSAVMHGTRDIRLEDRSVPRPGPREVLVRIAAVGVCGSDIHYYEHGRIGEFVVREPLVLGHETSGVVVKLGEGANRREVGQRVALEPGVPCGRCRECRAGRYNLCPDVRFFATPPVDGTFAEYVVIHEDFAHPLPESLSENAGALMEPLSVGVWACWKAQVKTGDHVLITGAGPIGLVNLMVARAQGATEVTVTDVVEERLALAREMGATNAINVAQSPLLESGVEAEVLIECSGNARALGEGIRSLAPAGRVVVVGMGPDEETSIPLSYLQTRELTLTGTFRYANTYPAAIELAASGSVDLDSLVTSHYGLDQTEAALRAPGEEPANVKPMVVPASG